ncbi:MAG: hypothetical protein QNJ69_11005 [Gammaproteobacteria bacterium]|nr:hypothetical protein [Gammaproteobacteria bacterium]
MSYRTLIFPGMQINRIDSDGDNARIDIDYAIIIKNMDDAEQDTRWHGKGILSVSELVIDSEELPEFPATVQTADIKDNQITYRNEVVFPFKYHGNVGISLQFENFGHPVKFIGEFMEFDVSEHEKYIEHISD